MHAPPGLFLECLNHGCYRVFLITELIQVIVVAPNQQMVAPKVISAATGIDQCPQGERRAALEEITIIGVLDILQIHRCGGGVWHRVAYLNINIPSQQCPSAWREFVSDGVRTCARPITSSGSCPGTFYPVRHQYSKVCGRVIGYQFWKSICFWARSCQRFYS